MSRRQVGAIDAELLDRVDKARGDVPRTKFVERALEETLGTSNASGAATQTPPYDGLARDGPAVPDPASPRTSGRVCERCHTPVGSPTMRYHGCGGKVVPPPGRLT